MAFIDVNHVSFSYSTSGKSVPVLTDVDLKVARGEMVAIQGPSGSGKSTLFYLLGCLLKLTSGRVVIGGSDVGRLSNEDLAFFRNQRIGFIFQQFHLLPKATVLENILLPTRYPVERAEGREEYREKAIRLAEDLGIGQRLNHLPNQLSGGQQQRVAIARALINDSEIILADEPTGNLDSKSSEQIMALLKELNKKGKTVLIITHDQEIARQCSNTFYIKDGKIADVKALADMNGPCEPAHAIEPVSNQEPQSQAAGRSFSSYIRLGRAMLPLALDNLRTNKTRSILTMLGVTIGIAALLAMTTVGQFTKRKILDSYADLGVNTLLFRGYPNWQLKATDMVSTAYRYFDWERDLQPLKRVFPEIEMMSPLLTNWGGRVHFAGRSIENYVQVFGVGEDALGITRRRLLLGNGLSPYHIEKKSSVCVIGFEIAQKLFANTHPIGQVLHISQNESSFGCRVIGVLEAKTSNKEWMKPDLQVFVPFTFFQAAAADHWWNAQINEALIRIRSGGDIEDIGKGVRGFFERKYGKSGEFWVDSDSVLIAQMKKFLNLFTIMLGSIAFVSLAVGGIGITNMMLVSVSERFKEIGLRKAVGATDFSIRTQFLVESLVVCTVAGVIGLVAGFVGYQGVIYGAAKLVPKLEFEWVLDMGAVGGAVVSIFIVGVCSGLLPALKAEELQVIEALRSE